MSAASMRNIEEKGNANQTRFFLFLARFCRVAEKCIAGRGRALPFQGVLPGYGRGAGRDCNGKEGGVPELFFRTLLRRASRDPPCPGTGAAVRAGRTAFCGENVLPPLDKPWLCIMLICAKQMRREARHARQGERMPRPRHCRYVSSAPSVTYFKPRGIPMRELEEATLSVEELEALRLADMEGLTAIEAAGRMRVSRFIFGRTLSSARRTVATALCRGLALRIEGGDYALSQHGSHSCCKEMNMSKIAVSSEGPTLDDEVDPRFGRAGGFVVVELPEMKVDYIDNGESQMMAMGAGIETAERMARAGVEVVISGYVGPKAFDALTAAGIKICQDVEGVTVREAVERFVRGELPFAEASNK